MVYRDPSRDRRFLALFVVAMVACSGPAIAKDRSDLDPNAFAAAIAKAELGDPSVDYLWLRKQVAARLAYVENNWSDWHRADALVDTDPNEALRLARLRISGVWTDFLPHIVMQLALEKLGKHDDAEREKSIVSAIVKSISGGHKGTAAADAFNAVSVAEEYRTLALLKWKSEQQSLVNQDGNVFDVLDVTNTKTNEKRQVWFNIDVFFGKEFGLK